MKYIYKILFSLVFLASVFSCDETIPEVIFDGDASTNRTFLSFPASVFNLPVAIDATGSVEVTLNSSTKSNVDRTFTINQIDEADVEDPESDPFTTANPLTYTLPSSVTIPADSYQATITIDGVDNNLVETAAKQIVFELEGLSESVDMDNNLIFVNIFEVCPIEEGLFTGNYLIEQITPINPCDGVPLFENQVVELSSTGATSRTFSAIYLEGISATFPSLNIEFSLVCNSVIVDESVSGLACAGAESNINVGPAITPGTYVATDDSVFEVTINEYYTQDGNCGCTPYDTTFRFTKQ